MRKKSIITLCIIFISTIMIYFPIRNHLNTNRESALKEEIANSILLYLMNDKNYESEIVKNIEVEHDRDANLYIATVIFEENPKALHLFIDENGEINIPNIAPGNTNANEITKITVIPSS